MPTCTPHFHPKLPRLSIGTATIAADHPTAARRFLDDFDAAIDRLVQFPELAPGSPAERNARFT
jgi:plasmid stabilization system protein ParE